jgi:hypothetical protein
VAVEAARQALAGLLKLDAQQIKVVSSELVEWPDSCLGAAAAGYALYRHYTSDAYLVSLLGSKDKAKRDRAAEQLLARGEHYATLHALYERRGPGAEP